MPHSPPHSVTSFISVPRAPIHSLGQNQYRRFSLIQIQVHMYVLLFGEKKTPQSSNSVPVFWMYGVYKFVGFHF